MHTNLFFLKLNKAIYLKLNFKNHGEYVQEYTKFCLLHYLRIENKKHCI